MKDQKRIFINASRVGKNASGLLSFTNSIVSILSKRFINVCIICSEELAFSNEVDRINVPAQISNTQNISLIRPILWFFYARFFFPKYRDAITLTTTHHVLPNNKNQVITIHDIRPYFYPDSIIQSIYFKYILPKALKNIKGVLTVSNTTKALIAREYDFPEEKIYVVPNYIDLENFYPKDLDYHELNKGVNDKPYLLAVGATWFHKNIHELIKYSSTWSEKYQLKIIASGGKYKKFLESIVKNLALSDKVIFFDHVNYNQLLDLYQNCSALVYPSLMEGFGIPPIEAMACMKPVIVSDIDVFHEIYGDVPIYIKHNSEASWINAISLLDNKKLLETRVLEGFKLAKNYNKDNMIKHLDIALTGLI